MNTTALSNATACGSIRLVYTYWYLTHATFHTKYATHAFENIEWCALSICLPAVEAVESCNGKSKALMAPQKVSRVCQPAVDDLTACMDAYQASTDM